VVGVAVEWLGMWHRDWVGGDYVWVDRGVRGVWKVERIRDNTIVRNKAALSLCATF